MNEGWMDVAAQADLPTDDVIAVRAGNREIALYAVGGEVFATDNICATAFSKVRKSNVRCIRAASTYVPGGHCAARSPRTCGPFRSASSTTGCSCRSSKHRGQHTKAETTWN
jgi:hypothetical protein